MSRPFWLRGGWVGPVGFPRKWTAEWLAAFRALDAGLAPWPICLGVALLIGVLPVLADYATGVRTSHLVTALLGVPLLLASAARGTAWPSLTCLMFAFLIHCITFATLAAHDPGRLALSMPKGEEYWRDTHEWLLTGATGAYEPRNWLRFHVLIAVVMVVSGYLSLGLWPLAQGLHELDLMNFYVGQYLAHSHFGPVSFLAWHPWSVVRGIGFLFIVSELASFSLERLTGEKLSEPSARLRRWGLGLGLLLLDGLIKWLFSESVRRLLAGQLVE